MLSLIHIYNRFSFGFNINKQWIEIFIVVMFIYLISCFDGYIGNITDTDNLCPNYARIIELYKYK